MAKLIGAKGYRINEMILGARNCLVKWGNIKAGESVLVVTDANVDPQLIEALATAAASEGATVLKMIMPTPPIEHQEPPRAVGEAMKHVDLAAICCSKLSVQNQTSLEAQKCGTRIMGIGPSAEAMASPGAKFPPEIIFELATRISKQWSAGKKIRVTCERGTDLQADINPDHVIGYEGAGAPLGTRFKKGADRRGRIAFWEGGFGTVGLWPEWTTNGVAYFDALQGFDYRLDPPFKIVVKDGGVVDLGGRPEQIAYFNNLREVFGPDFAHIGEIMIGLNPFTSLDFSDSSHLQAHRRAGTVHVAFGNSVDDHRRVKPGIHVDNLIIKPTISIDDDICVDQGHLVMLDDPDIRNMMKQYGVDLKAHIDI